MSEIELGGVQFNAKLAREVLEQIKLHPKNWNQAFWVTYVGDDNKPEDETLCNTAFCFAGWACEIVDRPALPAFVWGGSILWTGATASMYFTSEDHMDAASIPERAAYLLGLNSTDTDYLFCGDNTLEDLEFMVAAFEMGKSFEGSGRRELRMQWRDYRVSRGVNKSHSMMGWLQYPNDYLPSGSLGREHE